MKKIFCFIVICLSLIFTLSCSKEEDSKVTIITPYGIPLISVARLTNDKSISIEAVSGAEHPSLPIKFQHFVNRTTFYIFNI